jgi:hypothetical protein
MSSVEFNKLRKILAQPTSQRLDEVEQKIDSIEDRLKAPPSAEDVSEVLPEAVRIRARSGPELANTLGPVMELALDKSIARNNEKMATAMYPILGAMVRKYVAAGVRDATQSINLMVARMMTMEGLRWRAESLWTGVPIEAIAFRHSLVFRCEHVFLVHNRTAQPLFHLSSPDAVQADKLAFAGMIGAITDFIKDAFLREEPIGLRSISVGEFTIWFEEGPLATIAIVIHGEPQPAIRFRLRAASEQLHAQYAPELEGAMVDEVSLLNYDTVLRGTLLQKARDKEHKQRRLGRIVTTGLAVALVILGLFGFNILWAAHSRDARFGRFLSNLKSREGMLITDSGKEPNGKYFVNGLITGALPSGALPFEDFGLKRDEVDVKLLNSFAADQAYKNEELKQFQNELRELDGIAWPIDGSYATKEWLSSTTDRIVNAYVLGQQLGHPFIVVIKHPSNLKAAADRLSGQLAWRLYLRGVYDRHLIRTLPVDRQPAVMTVLQERTLGP